MADTKISALTPATSVDGTETIPLLQGGANKKGTLSIVKTWLDSVYAALSHAHGNITNAGAIGTTTDLPIITTTSGVLTAGAFGTGATNFCSGSDARLSDARTPAAHNQAETTITFTDVTTGNASTSYHGFSPKATAPGAGLISVLAIANGETVRTDKALFDVTNPAALGTAAPGSAVIAARRDHVHANPAIDTLAAATDITTLNASASAHGLLAKLENTGTKYLRDDGTWQTVAGGGSTQAFGTISVSGQSDVVADAAPDTLTLVAGTNITLTTNAGSDSITITATGGVDLAALHAASISF